MEQGFFFKKSCKWEDIVEMGRSNLGGLFSKKKREDKLVCSRAQPIDGKRESRIKFQKRKLHSNSKKKHTKLHYISEKKEITVFPRRELYLSRPVVHGIGEPLAFLPSPPLSSLLFLHNKPRACVRACLLRGARGQLRLAGCGHGWRRRAPPQRRAAAGQGEPERRGGGELQRAPPRRPRRRPP